MSLPLVGVFLGLLSSVSAAGPILQTTLGRVNGALCGDGDIEVASYVGIPYAVPPVGDLRWAAPVKYTTRYPASGLNATTPGSYCRQGDEGSEDCLYLNVWAPANARSSLPVRVFIHGGGYQTGSGSESIYEGCKLVKDGNVVFVTLNYRLGVLGFLALPELRDNRTGSVGNYGLLDQRLALQWIRDNIAAFGGDPRKVVLSGESAGAYSSLLHLVSPGSRGLFSAVMSFSGSADAMAVDFRKDAYTKGNAIREALNCSSQLSRARGFRSTAECLRRADAETVLAVQAALNVETVNFCIPHIDGVVLPRHPVRLVAQGNVTKVPVVLGVNANEGVLEVLAQTRDAENIDVFRFFEVVNNLIPVAPSFNLRLYQQYNAKKYFGGNWILSAINAITDGGYHCPSRRFAKYLSGYGVAARYFVLAPSQPNSGCALFLSMGIYLDQAFTDFMGAFHGYDIPFSFLAPYRTPYNQCPFTANETQLASFLSGITSAMAASNVPVPPRSSTLTSPLLRAVRSWPAWSSTANPVLIVDTASPQFYPAADLQFDAKCALWDDILESDLAAGTSVHT